MHIAAMNVRITFQKNTVVEDEIGNHTNEWTDFYSCYATTSTKTGNESEAAATTTVTEKLDFNVRYCSETAQVTPDGFRIKLKDRIYNILSIDDMAFKHRSLKMHAELVRRQDEQEEVFS